MNDDNGTFRYLQNSLAMALAKLEECKGKPTNIEDYLHDVSYHLKCATTSGRAIEDRVGKAKIWLGNV